MKHPSLIVLEALLLGQRVLMPTGHTLAMEDGKVWLVAETRRGEETSEILLDPGALGERNVFLKYCEAMNPTDLFVIGSQSAMIKMGQERAVRRLSINREVFEAEYLGSFPPPTPCALCGGTAQGRTVESCPACNGTGRAQ